ncbi:hypothetical protein [Streptomyces sp. NPDC017529]|uniref:hypothetical protein n=1 Tax=Streptomyces sp. NPDC017529 TaxID=3365000 RepID=UPI0037B34675
MTAQPLPEGADVMRRVLLFVMAALLAFPVRFDGAYGQAAGGGASARAGTHTASVVAPYAHDDRDSADTATERCPTGRSARSATGIPASHPGGDQTRCATDPTVPPAAAPHPTAPVTGCRAVPLTRSGQLPISHRVFRC